MNSGFDRIPAPAWSMSREGQLLQANPAFFAALGLAEINATHIADLVHPEDRPALLTALRVPEHAPRPLEFRFRHVDGSFRWFWVELAVTGAELTATAFDVTGRKDSERIKDEFVATLSHELRTPLTSIRGALGLTTSGVLGDVPAEANELLEIAERNCGRLSRLINDLLDLSKVESGKANLALTPLDPSELAEHAIEANAGYAFQYGSALHLVNTEPGLRILGDRDRLMQILANLLSNACKFSGEGARIDVSVRAEGDDTVVVSVDDEGPGIPETFQPRVFERFTQVDPSDTRRRGGSGLGLAVCRALVEQHGGSIDFEPSKRGGTVFHVRLPRWIPEALGRSRQRLLVCEDDPEVARILCRMLKTEGYSIDVAHSAQEAREKLKHGEYSAMTLDVGLPDQNGLSLLQDLRADGHDLPVVIVSAASDPADVGMQLRGDAFLMSDWITKPVSRKRLLASVDRATRDVGKESRRALLIDKDPDLARVVERMLDGEVDVDVASSLQEARRALPTQNYQLVIMDVHLPDGPGLLLLPDIRRHCPNAAIMLHSDEAVDAALSRTVTAALVKSRRTSDELLRAVRQLLPSRAA